MQNWYLFIDNSQIGPLSMAEVQSSLITPETMVWHEGMPQWLPAGQVPELAHLFCQQPQGAAGCNGTATPPPPHGATGYSAPGQSQGFHSPEGNQGYYGVPGNNYYVPSSGKDKTVAGILAILLGGFGAQYFYLGKIGSGFISIVLSLVTCGLWSVLMLVQGILMLTMTQQEFDTKYVYSDSVLPLF
ncbi:MAG: GYF domain-containing protein [Duncaniella sp.]|nr:GYF domain-containing protein [Duncaniella sp.]